MDIFGSVNPHYIGFGFVFCCGPVGILAGYTGTCSQAATVGLEFFRNPLEDVLRNLCRGGT